VADRAPAQETAQSAGDGDAGNDAGEGQVHQGTVGPGRGSEGKRTCQWPRLRRSGNRRIGRQSCHLVGIGFLYFVTIGGAPGSGGGALTTAKT
jgi:hypothetical protein